MTHRYEYKGYRIYPLGNGIFWVALGDAITKYRGDETCTVRTVRRLIDENYFDYLS